jgi:Zn-dependent peptidase ImmA (M78 family)/transcriptional regulator with XRE-family HTH domain
VTAIKDFNPEMLILARYSRGMTQTQLAKLVATSRGALSRFEAGTLPVGSDSLSRLAASLDYPVRFFCRKPTLLGATGGATFHRKRQSLSVRKLYQAHAIAEIRRLEVTAMLKSLDILPSALPEYPVEFFDNDPEKIARSVRTAMNIPPGPIFNLTVALERNGCIVVGHDFGARQIDGFSQRAEDTVCFFHISAEMPPDRWRWTLAHELGHMVMHYFEPTESPKVAEFQADLFAGEFLAPGYEIRHQLDGLTFQTLGGLKRQWGISMQALINRALRLGAISEAQRRSMYIRLSKAGYRRREPETLDPPVEKPTMVKQLAQRHLNELGYSRAELCDLLALNESEFRKHYIGSEDILEALGIDDLLQNPN